MAPSPPPARAPLLFLGYFLPPFLLLAAVSLLFYLQDLGKETRIHEREGRHLVELQSEVLTSDFASVESDLLFLLGQKRLRDFLGGDSGAARDLELEYLLFASTRRLYDQVRVLDETGQEVLRVNYRDGQASAAPPAALQSKASRYYFADTMALAPGQVYVSPFDLNIEHGRVEVPVQPVVRFATPLFDDRGERRGILVLNYLGRRLLARLRDLAGSFHGSSWLVNGDGYWLIGRRPGEEWGFMFGREDRFGDAFPEAWRRIGASATGQFRSEGGLFSYATVARAGPLKLIAFEPDEVVGARPRLLLRRLLSLDAVATLLLFVLSGFLTRGRLHRMRDARLLQESEGRLRQLSQRLVNAQEEERRRIARDLHDDLGQIVTSVSLDLQRALQQEDAGARRSGVERALRASALLLERIQEIAHQLRPSILDDLGLRDAIRSFAADFEAATGIEVRLEADFAHDRIPDEVGQGVFRILQEALTNVARHASASEVEVRLSVGADRVSLTVEDRGVGFQPGEGPGTGLGVPGMQERARLLGGTCRVRSDPGAGTRIEVTVPLATGGHPGRAPGNPDRE